MVRGIDATRTKTYSRYNSQTEQQWSAETPLLMAIDHWFAARPSFATIPYDQLLIRMNSATNSVDNGKMKVNICWKLRRPDALTHPNTLIDWIRLAHSKRCSTISAPAISECVTFPRIAPLPHRLRWPWTWTPLYLLVSIKQHRFK